MRPARLVPAALHDRQPRVAGELRVGLRPLAERERRAARVADHPLVAAAVAEPGRQSHRAERTLGAMAAWDDVRELALGLPETAERLSRGLRQWRVKDKLFVWERPLRRSDLEALGPKAPEGPILGARVEHEVAKQALIQDDPDVFFTTPHFDGYPAVLVRLDRIPREGLEEVVVEAWLVRAPKRLAEAYTRA